MNPDERGHDHGDQSRWSRRGVLKALVSVPVFGGFLAAYLDKRALERARRQAVLEELGVSESGPAVIEDFMSRPPGERIRLGIIGFGGEGEALTRYAGFASPEWIEDSRRQHREDPANKELETYLAQKDLNVAVTAICDLYDGRAEKAMVASAIDVRPEGAPANAPAKRYRRYTDMLESGDVDAVIIATPDHWHAQMSIDAEAAGIHVYCEKCMTRTEEEALAMLEAFRGSDVKFQLGHQNRQSESHMKAREIMDADILGDITLIEGTTNRNTPWGAWVWDIPEDAGPDNVDWAQFQQHAGGSAPFSLERFFRWRCWFDYGTGLSGDLMSHEYDAVNMVLGLGIPKSVVASGGIYHFKDGRDVPDVFQAVCEYPDRDLTFMYSATLANGNYRGLQFMGHDGTMRLAGSLDVVPDNNSTRYEDKLEEGIISPDRPMFTYRPGFKGIDAVTSATAEYFASRGLLYTYRGGRRVSAYHLHIAEWLDAIRNGGTPSCDIEQGFQEAITCHMATRSYLEGRQVEWDPVRQRIV
ncbi:MAG: Gfo/Idh/MocA family oxidoreductase [Gemmatimonadetes bacterium]|nr:Gfo/Idh/MocA family oxidoreductase [Gemmatimonadota bacterium]NIQ55034.1 Gfo/Idh/MocA family oxidoreductase [Gemmatimonadota bacterium]NIU75225.1 Gfo/Idh/MocA family oxidoreductase [Gammaproteobacteria bacterium]NIX45038.1 Gfo/Idh/MocA family oxidoreductase [Gemmatimonadota bacterium]NIY09271.1 Gfo/Idh/MocA family oxidoreductase [Gemmatimonadota bacterium]